MVGMARSQSMVAYDPLDSPAGKESYTSCISTSISLSQRGSSLDRTHIPTALGHVG